MNKQEWAEHLRSQIAKAEEDAEGQRQLAEYQKSFPEQQRLALHFANELDRFAEEFRQQLKRLEELE